MNGHNSADAISDLPASLSHPNLSSSGSGLSKAVEHPFAPNVLEKSKDVSHNIQVEPKRQTTNNKRRHTDPRKVFKQNHPILTHKRPDYAHKRGLAAAKKGSMKRTGNASKRNIREKEEVSKKDNIEFKQIDQEFNELFPDVDAWNWGTLFNTPETQVYFEYIRV